MSCGPCAGTNAPAVIQTTQPHHPGAGPPTTGQRSPAKRSHALDGLLWKLTFKWANLQPLEQADVLGRSPVLRPGSTRPGSDRWVFGDRDSGAYMLRFGWTKIVRHQIVTGTVVSRRPCPGRVLGRDGDARRPPGRSTRPSQWLIKAQDGRCPICRDAAPARRRPATNPTRVGTVAGEPPARRLVKPRDALRENGKSGHGRENLRLIHAHCRNGGIAPARRQRPGASAPPAILQGLLEPWCGENPLARF